MGAAGLIGQAAMVLFLTFFLLLSGDTYKRKPVRLSGPSLSRRKITVHILDDINASIQRYMSMLLATNVLLGLLTWITLRSFALENAGAWAVAAGLQHVIPYFGPAVTAVGVGKGRPSCYSIRCRRQLWWPELQLRSPRLSEHSLPPG